MSVDQSQHDLDMDRDAEFVRLYSANRARLFAFIGTLLRNWEDAEDVLQQTSIVLRQKFDRFDPTRDFLKWACGVAYRKVLQFREQQSRRQQAYSEVLLERLARTRIARSDLLESRRLVLDECVAKLAQSDQRIVEHYYYQGRKTAAQVAEELARPTNTILRALVRIRRSLRVCVDRMIAREHGK